MKTKVIIASCFVLLASTATAQQQYTLEQCKELALKNNITLTTKQLDVNLSKEQQKEAFTNYFPTIHATGSYLQANKEMLDMDITIPQMGTLPLSKFKKGKMAAIMATQPIFAGGRIVNGNKLAKIGKEAAELQQKLSTDETLLTTEHLFWQLVDCREKLKTITVIEKQLEQIYHDVDQAVQAGVSTRNDLLRVKLRQQEIASNRLKVENGLHTLQLALCQFIGISPAGFSIAAPDISMPQSPAALFVEAPQAVEMRSETHLLNKNVAAFKLKKQIEIGKRLPSVGVSAGYVYNDFMGKDQNFLVGMLQVNIPLSDWWGGSHAIKQKKIAYIRAKLERKNSREQMEVQVEQTWGELQEAYKQVLLGKTSIASATENMRLNQNCYKAGTIPLSELLDAQSLLQQSKNSYSAAFTAYQMKRYSYLKVTAR